MIPSSSENICLIFSVADKEDEDYPGEVLQGQTWKSHISLLLEFHWLETNYKATLTCKGDWERPASFEPRNKEVVYEHLDSLCNPELSTDMKETPNRTTDFNLRWVVERVWEKTSWKKGSLNFVEK